MSKYTGPKCRLCRRAGIKLFLKGEKCETAKCIFLRKNYVPGQHGQGSFSKPSEYGKQLREKQKARWLYGIGERQFRNYYLKAARKKEATGDAFLKMLELRLDNVVYRSSLVPSRNQARQIISHGLIELNGRKVTIPSIQTKVGDKFVIRKSSQASKLFEPTKRRKDSSPKWMKVDLKNLSGEVIAEPESTDFEASLSSQVIVEYYSK